MQGILDHKEKLLLQSMAPSPFLVQCQMKPTCGEIALCSPSCHINKTRQGESFIKKFPARTALQHQHLIPPSNSNKGASN